MNKILDENWVGRGGPVAWPPRSPDLTSADYFLWGFVKEPSRACAEITPQMLAEVRRSFYQRIDNAYKSRVIISSIFCG